MKKIDKLEISIWVAAALPLLLTAVFYTRLPASVPTHWGLSGQIDAYSPKALTWLMPALALGLSALMKWMPALDPKRANYDKFKTGYRAFRLVFALFLLLMTAMTLYAAFDPTGLPVSRVVTAGVGVLFCVLGNYMPKFRHNYFCGIRTPWTLASEDVWAATHRLGGIIWFIGGLILLIAALLPVSEPVLFCVILGTTAVFTLVPCVYSFILYKKTQTPLK